MRTLEEQAISSQNFFFLRLAAGREVEEIILEELEGFLECLENEHDTLKSGVKNQITNEIEEGDYFTNKTIEQATAMLNGASARVTGSTMETITRFYLSLIVKTQNEARGESK